MPERAISVAFGVDSPRARYAAEVLLGLIGVPWREAATGEAPDLGYGIDGRCTIPAGPRDGWDDPRPLLARSDGLPILHRPGGPALARGTSAASLGFDALYASYACLTGAWERLDPADDVGCPIAAQGWLEANGLLHEPLVHRYAQLLGEALAGIGVRLRLPAAALVLTHDVDSNFGHLFAVRESWELFRREVRALKPSSARRAAGLVRRLARLGRSDPNDRWDDWARLTASWGGRPAYFVASYGLFDPGAARYDPPYDVRHPEVAGTFRRLAAGGAEIGIHFSLEARQSAERLRLERERLEKALGIPIRSARHHWWALGRPPEPTLRAHALAGIAVDCSLGFNDRAGFRRGIARPFRPFDPETGTTLPIWALPTTVMDLALFPGRHDADEAARILRSLLNATSRHGGAFVLNWHAHALNPRVLHGAGKGLLDFMGSLVADRPRFATPLELVEEVERLSPSHRVPASNIGS